MNWISLLKALDECLTAVQLKCSSIFFYLLWHLTHLSELTRPCSPPYTTRFGIFVHSLCVSSTGATHPATCLIISFLRQNSSGDYRGIITHREGPVGGAYLPDWFSFPDCTSRLVVISSCCYSVPVALFSGLHHIWAGGKQQNLIFVCFISLFFKSCCLHNYPYGK